jgi:hypothetical protein
MSPAGRACDETAQLAMSGQTRLGGDAGPLFWEERSRQSRPVTQAPDFCGATPISFPYAVCHTSSCCVSLPISNYALGLTNAELARTKQREAFNYDHLSWNH